ncbi:MAG: patatin-like phospholipase family protein [Gammaproteobacteria bacterium]|nr:patatin-like phospholipase family protein [Gammaproteobacteria bacterium]NNF60541.1 BamA/TamA family outer membrane protein [Gammaproteobacteria bacterium]NNM20277.1 BamA/TamA family outer membrane protein [Gammaproteobacteria bacterium]
MNLFSLRHACVPLLLLAATLASAATERPKVGLVLSGGGARGAAHVGVLKVLEELRVPVDIITGTSMGAVVGGLYAMGYSADELGDLVNEIDWNDNLDDDPGRSALSFRRKQDDRSFLVDFDLGLRRDGVHLPLGLVQGQKMNLLLRARTLPVEHIDDFDQLPIPFRAVATDIETGAPVVLGSGDLATAMRASMAVPGAFAPVDYQGRLLVDGGVSNNLPIDVARSLGADVLIVVDIQFPLLARDELRSAVDITGQLLTILVIRESNAQLATLSDQDIVIVPDLGSMGSTDFDLAPQAIDVGAESAWLEAAALARLSVPETEYSVFAATRKQQHRQPVISDIRVTGTDSVSESILLSQLDIEPGPVDLQRLDDSISRLYGMNTFQIVDYQIVDEPDGSAGLQVTAIDKSWGPAYLNFGARLVDDLDGASSYTLAARYTRTGINKRGAELRSDLQVGTNPRLFSEFYQPLDRHWLYFVAPQLDLQRIQTDLFADDKRIATLQLNRAAAGLDFGRTFGNWGELRLGLWRETGRISRRVGTDDPDPNSFDSGSIRLRFVRDMLDDDNFPRTGWRTQLGWDGFRSGLGADTNRDRVAFSSLWAASQGRGTWVVAAQAGSNLRATGEVQDLFDLGGLFRLSGFRNGQLRGQHFGVVDLAHYRRLDQATAFGVPIYAGVSVELGNVWDDSDAIGFSDMRLAGSVFLGLDTFIGPLYLAYGIAEGGRSAAYFQLGQGFD